MTGHQEHPGTGVSVQGHQVGKVILEDLIKGVGVKDLKVVDSFNIKEIRTAVKDSLERDELSVIIVRGACAVRVSKQGEARIIDTAKCNQCGICLLVGCPAIQTDGKQPIIDITSCTGCSVCEQICPKRAIGPASRIQSEVKK